MKRIIFFILALSTISAGVQQLPGIEEKDTVSARKASFLYNFTKYIDWPDEYKSGNFVISVMGSTALHQELVKNYTSKQVGSQQIEIRKVSKTVNINKCHVLYVGKECTDILPDIVKALKDEPTLIVTDDEGTLKKGAALNFVWDKSSLRFELNVGNATGKNLFIGATLKSLAHKVE